MFSRVGRNKYSLNPEMVEYLGIAKQPKTESAWQFHPYKY